MINKAVHPDDSPLLSQGLARSFQTGKQFAMKYRLRRFDGVFRWMDSRAVPMRNSDGEIVQWYGLCSDIENEKTAQEALHLAKDRLSRATQAAGLAELSASIAHEINQPLAAILANSQAVERWMAFDPPNLERAKRSASAVVRDANAAADIVSRIRFLFKQSAPVLHALDSNLMISEIFDLLAEELARKNIRLDLDLPAVSAPISADRIQLQQLITNLVRNAADATSEAGASAMGIQIRVAPFEDYTKVSVRDHGRGITAVDRVFEPFFTTKAKGMGMGLAICRSIVEAHSGRLWVEQSGPQGTNMSFALPTPKPSDLA